MSKEFKIKENEIRKIIDSNMVCVATDKITVDGSKIGFMYREKPSEKYDDSGWRFFAGDEIQEYMSNPNNSDIYSLNTICNYDKNIIPFLDSEYGVAYYKNKNGKFEIDKEWKVK